MDFESRIVKVRVSLLFSSLMMVSLVGREFVGELVKSVMVRFVFLLGTMFIGREDFMFVRVVTLSNVSELMVMVVRVFVRFFMLVSCIRFFVLWLRGIVLKSMVSLSLYVLVVSLLMIIYVFMLKLGGFIIFGGGSMVSGLVVSVFLLGFVWTSTSGLFGEEDCVL